MNEAPDTCRRSAMGSGQLLCLTVLVLIGCGKSSTDCQIPTSISDLAGRARNDSTIVLTWSAPSVGSRAPVAGYDIRYSETAAGLDSVECYIRWPYFGRPAAPGNGDSVTVAGLKRGSRYFFRAWGLTSNGEPGEDGNIAEISTLPDTIPPGRITDLAVTGRGADRLTLTWTAPGDDGDRGPATSYRIAYESGAHEAVDLNQAVIQIPAERPYLAGVQQQVVVTGLDPRSSYTIVVLTRDEVGQESQPSNVLVGTTDRLPQDWYVYADGSGDAPTIQAAIDSTRDGEIVWIGPGTYRENLRILDQPEDLRSLDGAEQTIIDGSLKAASTIEIRRTLRDTTRVMGLTITGGSGVSVTERSDEDYLMGGGVFAQDSHLDISGSRLVRNGTHPSHPEPVRFGGGIYCERRFSKEKPCLTISNSTISTNVAQSNGGGVGVVGASPHVTSCVMKENRTVRGDGGAIWFLYFSATAAISDCLIEGNSAGDHGGGLYVGHPSQLAPVDLRNCIIANNVANQAFHERISSELGAGLWLFHVTGLVQANTIVANGGSNEATLRGGAISLLETAALRLANNIIAYSTTDGGLACFDAAQTDIRDNLFWMNHGGDLIGCEAGQDLNRNLFLDPLFCNPVSESWAVSADSPVLHQPSGRIGADTNIGCGLGAH